MSEQAGSINLNDLPPHTTICRDCVFAEWDGDTQSGCEMGRIEAFEGGGTQVVGIDDGHRKYLAIVGRFCNTCRNHDWGVQYPRNEWVGRILDYVAVRVHFVIYVDDDTSVEASSGTIESSLDQGSIRPAGISLVINGVGHEPRDFVRMFRTRRLDIPWNVKRISPLPSGKYPDYGDAIDQSVREIDDRTTFYAVARAGYSWASNYLESINIAINHRMMRLVAIVPEGEDDGLLMDVRLHKHLLGGNKGQGVVEKVLAVASDQGMGHMVRTWREVAECVSRG